MELIEAFGIDYQLLIANLVTFGLLLGILYKFGYTPILKFVDERTKKIEAGIQKAEEAEQALRAAQAEQERVLTEARTEAQGILATAREQAEIQAVALVEHSKDEARKVVEKAKKDIRFEHEQMLQEAKSDIAELVILTTEKLLREKMDVTHDKAFVEKTLSEIGK